jgi:hypothetical protein
MGRLTNPRTIFTWLKRKSRRKLTRKWSAPLLDRSYNHSSDFEDSDLDSQVQNEDLCSRCRKIDLSALFSRRVTNRYGDFITDLEASKEELAISHCKLCRLFGSVSPKTSGEGANIGTKTCHLRAFSTNEMFIDVNGKKSPWKTATDLKKLIVLGDCESQLYSWRSLVSEIHTSINSTCYSI